MSGRAVTAKAILLILALCAVCDFVWGYIKRCSIPAGVISIVLGLFGTALYCFLMRAFRKDKDESDTSPVRCVSPAPGLGSASRKC